MPCHPRREPSLPFKVNADRRQHIPKQRFRATNWSEYDAALCGRDSLTIWFTEAAISAWKAEPRTTRGGQPRSSALAINTALTLRAVFRLALRQTEGLIGWHCHIEGFLAGTERLSQDGESDVRARHLPWVPFSG